MAEELEQPVVPEPCLCSPVERLSKKNLLANVRAGRSIQTAHNYHWNEWEFELITIIITVNFKKCSPQPWKQHIPAERADFEMAGIVVNYRTEACFYNFK